MAAGGKPSAKDENGMKEWPRNKLKVLAKLLGRLGVKAAEALWGIFCTIIIWVLNRPKEVLGWVAQNLWALVVGVMRLVYIYYQK